MTSLFGDLRRSHGCLLSGRPIGPPGEPGRRARGHQDANARV